MPSCCADSRAACTAACAHAGRSWSPLPAGCQAFSTRVALLSTFFTVSFNERMFSNFDWCHFPSFPLRIPLAPSRSHAFIFLQIRSPVVAEPALRTHPRSCVRPHRVWVNAGSVFPSAGPQVCVKANHVPSPLLVLTVSPECHQGETPGVLQAGPLGGLCAPQFLPE